MSEPKPDNYFLTYDAINDVLYLSFGHPVESYGEEKYDGIVFRYAFFTDQLSGITIFDFMKKVSENKLDQLLLPFNFEQVLAQIH